MFLSIKSITTDEEDQMVITQNSTVVFPAPDQSVVPAPEFRLDTQAQDIVQMWAVFLRESWRHLGNSGVSKSDICAG